MTIPQRVVLIAYCLLVAYCCLWVPWHFAEHERYLRVGYGWIWVGPSKSEIVEADLTAPDLPIIALRLFVVTALCGAGWVLASAWTNAKRSDR